MPDLCSVHTKAKGVKSIDSWMLIKFSTQKHDANISHSFCDTTHNEKQFLRGTDLFPIYSLIYPGKLQAGINKSRNKGIL